MYIHIAYTYNIIHIIYIIIYTHIMVLQDLCLILSSVDELSKTETAD